MNALKVSLSGQTFALAKCHDSHGKKSRIRRTKEERRNMVESFINEYRISNNGKFPSLNLTHKEVGGSFYIVREIVRELIQENKVLGPATLTSEELRADHISEQYVSNSSSAEPYSHFSSSEIGSVVDYVQKESLAITNDVHSMCKDATVSKGQYISRCYEMVESKDRETIKSPSNGLYIRHFVHDEDTDQQQNLYNGRYINGNEECKEGETTGKVRTQVDELIRSEVVASKKLDDEVVKKNESTGTSTSSSANCEMVFKSVESDSTSESKIVMNVETGNVSVLTDDLLSAATSSQSLSEGSAVNAMDGMLQSQETNLPAEKMELLSGLLTSDTIPSGDMSSGAVGVRTETEIATSFPASNETPANEFPTHKISYLSEDTGLKSSISHNNELNLDAYDKKHLPSETELQPHSPPNDSNIEKAASVTTIDSTLGESFSSEADQISSGSSEKATEEAAVAGETNPIWVAIKVFITAFVKFWVE